MRKYLVLSFLLPAMFSCSMAQNPTQNKYAELLTVESAREHLTTLTSKEYAGRGTGQEGGQKAAEYIAKTFKDLGLKPAVNGSYFQPVALEKSSYVVDNFKINNLELINGKDLFVQGTNDLTNYDANEIVFVGYGIQSEKYNDLKGLDIAGKIVMFLSDGEPTDKNGNSLITGDKTQSDWSTSRFKKAQELMKLKPKLIIATGRQTSDMIARFGARLTGGRFTLRNDKSEKQTNTNTNPPVVNITLEAANNILSAKKTTVEKAVSKINNTQKPNSFVVKTAVKASMGIKAEEFNDPNVLGYIEGTDKKDEIVIISSHYDHDGILPDGTFFPGADDNGSGTVGVLELAKAFAAAKNDGHGPRRTILFMGFAAEEKGLLGSDYYSQHPVFPLANTVTCLNMDMIGRIDDKHLKGNHNYIHAIGSDMLSSELKAINEQANKTYTQMELDYMYDDPKDPMRIYYRSDQYNLAKHGIPVIFFFSGLHPDYHTPNDTVDRIDFNMMTKREKLVFHTAWEIANRDNKLVVDKTPAAK
ncbi:M28 family peptidase [Sphingobacterium sp. DK4209]|uniref:M28 family peptidase n=1 Tax=Sphingobacterium zhuxiongii TaxID=2662364 RepID=A0A5Q0Q9B6_9SPHI|nr:MULTISPECIES: M28 family peptidase [unclassified Sphingobacterium]MVZ66660.1 M28 family peptidase [Sphingobacterium sp. DK4209]QGA25431.1 M28 family peptidase [Sphingobacterium sp. dk4302]